MDSLARAVATPPTAPGFLMPSASRSKAKAKKPTGRQRRSNGDATRARILDVAEKLFAQHGYSAVSIRQITAAAKVNVAAIHFHFASKEALFESLIDCSNPMNNLRQSLLKEALAKKGGARPDISDIVVAYARPYLDLPRTAGTKAPPIMQFMARSAIESDPALQKILKRRFSTLWDAFFAATREAMPNLSEDAVNWGFFFMVGSLWQININPARAWLTRYSQYKFDTTNTAHVFKYLLPFVIGGLRALADIKDSKD
jgi:AcrR family transcriptional regulator